MSAAMTERPEYGGVAARDGRERRESPHLKATVQLREYVSNLDETVMELERVIDPLLMPENEMKQPSVSEVRGPSSPAVSDLFDLQEHVQRIQARVARLLQRAEL